MGNSSNVHLPEFASGQTWDDFGQAAFRPDSPEDRCAEVEDSERAKIRDFAATSMGRRRNSVSGPSILSTSVGWVPPVHPKSQAEIASIKESIRQSPALQVLFGHLSASSVDAVVGAMLGRDVQNGEVVIEQGADGDFFYIVDTGAYDIFVQRRADMPPERVMTAFAGHSFGELALMYHVPRAATVQCVQPGRLWSLDRESFQTMLATAENTRKRHYEGFLANIPILNELTRFERSHLSDILQECHYGHGEEILRQGDFGDAVYFLFAGECKAYISSPHTQGEDIEVRHYATPGEYFGEVALLLDRPRSASIRAWGGATVLKLKHEDVDFHVGTIHQRLMELIRLYPDFEANPGPGNR
mmetsp:Transcript_12191/g.28433  ORF Transcript_12191/g.28433 Transcript_12191/m.28433 type:complete len:358 (-) Transcript_12191:43-1116(-)